jgi:hypothetical protein
MWGNSRERVSIGMESQSQVKQDQLVQGSGRLVLYEVVAQGAKCVDTCRRGKTGEASWFRRLGALNCMG